MKYLFITGIFLVLVNIVFAKNNIKEKNGEDYYLVFINNTYGEFKIYSESKYKKREESQIFIESLIDEINDLIVDNIDTYEDLDKLKDFENASKLKKRNNSQPLFFISNSDYIYPIASVDDTVVLYTYLSKRLIPKINSMEYVYNCIQNEKSFKTDNYYNKNDIINETHWSDVEIQENAELHLSLISQGKINKEFISKYDNNFYYPPSAGKDINIVIMDTSFHFNHPEFSNTHDRFARCAANIENGIANLDRIDYYCGDLPKVHGESVADLAGGLIYGVAKRANIYGVSIEENSEGNLENKDILGGLQYIYEKLVEPHKTVINLSLGGYYDSARSYYETMKKLVDGITNKGGIIVASAGNGDDYLKKNFSSIYIPCELNNVICVGSIDSKASNNLYTIAQYTNYGPSVDIYAPGDVKVNVIDNRIISKTGTSFSAPLVSGMIASHMSEHKDVEFDLDKIKEFLKTGEYIEPNNYKNNLILVANNGKHIVYSSDNIYYGCEPTYPEGLERKDYRCGPEYGNGVCSGYRCCSSGGWCGESFDHCNVSSGCQSEFGFCHGKTSIEPIYPEGLERKDYRCGPEYGNGVCSGYRCCSSGGWCGESFDHCNDNIE
ncbi:subtilisin-like protein [Anaeromyces robustus]|uniref:Subtilisin-like protein n=1 Tax=Anaeromyces robustus TaxID=1754192 RepID=A0A1Y1WYB6_9FUNG|nr:subtilisin-like protein [Anaeromyces robustus]|eukprot:ORX78375.1 subtilisin-like protein [Anaeromyces robustus]